MSSKSRIGLPNIKENNIKTGPEIITIQINCISGLTWLNFVPLAKSINKAQVNAAKIAKKSPNNILLVNEKSVALIDSDSVTPVNAQIRPNIFMMFKRSLGTKKCASMANHTGIE